jgi:NADH-quinone oxidoreductase subunit L
MSYSSYIALIPLLPLVSFLLLGFFGKKLPGNTGGIIGVLSLLTSAGLSLFTAWQYFFVDGMEDGVYKAIIPFKYTWLTFSENMSIDMGIILDPVSVMMLVVVTFVSLKVHIFSLGYMKGEARFSTYYSYLSLFTFSMLGLVVSTNIFQIYMFWELVGVSSYLLIGYYFEKPSAVAASKKAFIVTRFADLGFLIGILILGLGAGSLDFMTIMARLTGDAATPELTGMITTSFLGVSALTWALTLIFIGGAGKSAMFPLHIWLPDAMEGPTPVSALIHAATMVVAGVYLVARLFPVFSNDPAAMEIVTWVGVSSAVFAAIIACTQTDIKRVLAYSTMSQIGYMMFALGISGIGTENGTGYVGSLFHLFTHAFFKSLLFLGAGAVIHMVHSNDMKDMGGLRKYMPITHLTFLIACLAIAGIPPFAGFFSKEEILLAAWNANKAVYYLALITSGITAFYMFRLYFSIFFQKEAHLHDHHGEGTFSMKLPLIILGTLTVVSGFIPFASLVTPSGIPGHSEIHLLFSIAPVLLALTGITVAYVLYFRENEKPATISVAMGGLYKAAYSKFYIDEIYLFITKKVLFNLIGRPAAWIDKNIVDGLMNFTGYMTVLISELTRGLQSGKVQNYAIYFIGGVITLTVYFIYFWK